MKRIRIFIVCAIMSAACGTMVLAQSHRHTERNDSVEEEILANAPESIDIKTQDVVTGQIEGLDESISDIVDEAIAISEKTKDLRQDRTGRIYSAADEAMLVGLVAVIGFFFGPAIILAIILIYMYKRKKQRDQVVIAAINKGVEIPEGYGNSTKTKIYNDNRRENTMAKKTNMAEDPMMHQGIKTISIGLGLVVLFSCFHLSPLVGIGWFVAIYGGGKVAIAYFSSNRINRAEEPKYTRTVEKVEEDEKSE